MTTQTPTAAPPGPVDVERAEAALIEHYPRLVRLGYLVLPASMGRHQRTLAAHALVQRALPRGRAAAEKPPLPAPRGGGRPADAGYAYLRLRVVRAALAAPLPYRLGGMRLRWVPKAPMPLPRVLGLRVFPRSGGSDELALEQALAELSGPGRAAYVLQELERLSEDDTFDLLEAAGVDDPEEALDEADEVVEPAGSKDRPLLESPDFDPCTLQARPTDLMRRRQHTRAAIAAVAALAVCGLLLGLPGDTWGRDGAAAPSYARNPASERALNPERLARVQAAAWETSARTDFSVWPVRGELADDEALLRRALTVWARPGNQVNVTVTPGTQPGPPSGPPQLLYAGEVDGASVVLLYDGLRIARYAEPSGGKQGPVGLDFARTDGADLTASSAVLLTRSDGNARYLLAPWVTDAAVSDLRNPADRGRSVEREDDGVTEPLISPPLAGGEQGCESWPGLRITAEGRANPYVLTDLGELMPVRLTQGNPQLPPSDPRGAAGRGALARTVCHLPSLTGNGVRAVNTWAFAAQRLPDSGGRALWLCTRADTWRGDGSRAFAQFQPPTTDAGAPSAIVSRTQNDPSCSARSAQALSGVLWKSGAENWYLLAAGSRQVASISATGDVRTRVRGRVMAAEAKEGAKAELTAKLRGGGELRPLG
ncbi:hypothetical protein QNO07_11720 [Streptomyces sp. 549]|uniref:hypothetical protein n=1 Tax=Streptomyces sp. 549 TaxID=3049076 RepID=UPI0024C368F7|nr:hypothetical protein [Streptomyces sp. 549]MDK1474075.1 hypothetical protein [Streptomyces sp. 549]